MACRHHPRFQKGLRSERVKAAVNDKGCMLTASILLYPTVNCKDRYSFHHLTSKSKSSSIIMEALLKQSRSMCPFLNKTSPATLRSLSTTTTTTRHVSPGGGTMSNLQVLARRCPVMGKAINVQAAKTGTTPLNGVFGGVRAYGGKAKIHTSRQQKASVASDMLRDRSHGISSHRVL